MNIPIGLAAIALTARFVPESRARRPRRPDPVGQALIVVMLGSLTYAIIEGPAFGWRAPVIVTLFAVSAAALAVFVAYEAHRTGARLPMLGAGLGPLRTGFVAASHAGWLLLAAMGGVVFVLALVTTSQWALGTAARTAATFDTGDPGTGEPRAAGPLRLLPRDLPQGP